MGRRRANAPASSECGGPPPLWDTSPFVNQAAMIRLRKPRVCARRAPLNQRGAREKSIHSLVSNICAGPQLQRTGALHDAGAFHHGLLDLPAAAPSERLSARDGRDPVRGRPRPLSRDSESIVAQPYPPQRTAAPPIRVSRFFLAVVLPWPTMALRGGPHSPSPFDGK